jgi:hypothetical protein
VNSIDSGLGPVSDCCEHGDEPSGSGAMDLVLIVSLKRRFTVSLTTGYKNVPRFKREAGCLGIAERLPASQEGQPTP